MQETTEQPTTASEVPDGLKAAALCAIKLIRDAHQDRRLKIAPRELPWLDRMQTAIEQLPSKENAFIDQMMGTVDASKFIAKDYFG